MRSSCLFNSESPIVLHSRRSSLANSRTSVRTRKSRSKEKLYSPFPPPLKARRQSTPKVNNRPMTSRLEFKKDKPYVVKGFSPIRLNDLLQNRKIIFTKPRHQPRIINRKTSCSSRRCSSSRFAISVKNKQKRAEISVQTPYGDHPIQKFPEPIILSV